MNLKTFEDVITESREALNGKKPHILLGNGFSRAYNNDIFAYGALFDRADFQNLSPCIRKAFTALDTFDFEQVMRALSQASTLVTVYAENNGALVKGLQDDAVGLREVLAKVIADNHPSSPQEISEDSYKACKQFLSNFHRIYTVNYDLLLYWTLMQQDVPPKIHLNDGFSSSTDSDKEYVVWNPRNARRQTIYYVHGAFHLFEKGHELQKYTWSRTKIPLIDQIRSEMGRGFFPLFVSEGSSSQKLDAIRHNAYLSKVERSLIELGKHLIVFGLSFSENDEHILSALKKNKVKCLYVSLYGDPDEAHNQNMIQRVQALKRSRPQLRVQFFRAESACIWG